MVSLKVNPKNQILSGFTLKRIAVFSMIIDHFASIIMDGVIAPYITDGALYFTDDMPWIVLHAIQIKDFCDVIGSIAFPLFCYLVVEGFLHTRNPVRYGLRMGLFAVISEIPYNIAHYQTLFEPKLQNVMFTLCVGIFTLLVLSYTKQRFVGQKTCQVILITAVIAAGMTLAFVIRGEYVFLGVLTISLMYLFRKNVIWQLTGLVPLMVASPWVLLAAVPILLYNGKRGNGSQYFFYLFYPAHFLVFAAIAALLATR